jgi:hypothetical protein
MQSTEGDGRECRDGEPDAAADQAATAATIGDVSDARHAREMYEK